MQNEGFPPAGAKIQCPLVPEALRPVQIGAALGATLGPGGLATSEAEPILPSPGCISALDHAFDVAPEIHAAVFGRDRICHFDRIMGHGHARTFRDMRFVGHDHDDDE